MENTTQRAEGKSSAKTVDTENLKVGVYDLLWREVLRFYKPLTAEKEVEVDGLLWNLAENVVSQLVAAVTSTKEVN